MNFFASLLLALVFSATSVWAGTLKDRLKSKGEVVTSNRCTLSRNGSELVRATCDQHPLSLHSVDESTFEVDLLAGYQSIALHGEVRGHDWLPSYLNSRLDLLIDSCLSSKGCSAEVKAKMTKIRFGCDGPQVLLALFTSDYVKEVRLKGAELGRGLLCRGPEFDWMVFDILHPPLFLFESLNPKQLLTKSDFLQVYFFEG